MFGVRQAKRLAQVFASPGYYLIQLCCSQLPPFVQENPLPSQSSESSSGTPHTTQRRGGGETNIATKPYLRGIALQSARLPALASHLFCVMMCVRASGQGDSLGGQAAKESYLRR